MEREQGRSRAPKADRERTAAEAMSDEKKDDDKKEDDKEEEEEEEEEDEEDEDEEDDDDDDEGDINDVLLAGFSDEAKNWGKKHFRNPMYARFFEKFKDRAVEDLKEMDKKRTWDVDLRNIKFFNNFEEKDPFIRFNIGWDFELRKIKEKGPRKKDKNGKLLPRRYKWVQTGSMGYEWYTNDVTNVARGKLAEFHTSWKFTARKAWSYFDLYDKKICLEVWDKETLLPNEFIARASMPMVQLATNEMAVQVPVLRNEKIKKRIVEIDVGYVSFTMIFQEVCEYSLNFVNWTGRLLRKYLPNETKSRNNPFVEISLKSHGIINYITPKPTVRSTPEVIRYGADDDVVYPTFKNISHMKIKGTRVALESKVLDLKVYDKIGVLPGSIVLIGRGSLPLQGASTGRSLTTRLCWKRPYSRGKQDADADNDSGEVTGSIDVFCDKSKLWREFAQRGEVKPVELRVYRPYWYTYLCIKIVQANDLIAADTSGTSDPYFTVEWAGTKLRTRTIMETCDPEFDEELYFKIECFKPDMPSKQELQRHPFIQLLCWDYDESGVSELLGGAKVYLHAIADVPNPTARQILLREKDGGAFAPTQIITRQLKKTVKLEGLGPGVESTCKIEAFFLGPLTTKKRSSPNLPYSTYKQVRKGDIYEPNLEIRKATGSALLRLKHFNTYEDARKNACCHCFSPLATELVEEKEENDSDDGVSASDLVVRRKVCQPSLDAILKNKPSLQCATLTNAMDLLVRIGDYPHVIQRQKDFLNRFCSGHEDDIMTGLLRGKNMNHELHFLPTFLAPITPPQDMIDNYKPRAPHELKGSHGHSELDCIVCFDSQKPNTAIKLFDLINWTEYRDSSEDAMTFGDDYGGRKSWCEPNLYFEMRRGDIKSHVLGLACLFLGIKLDAYVCIGTIVDPERKKEIPHVWLMTRESTSAECIKAFATNEKQMPEFRNRRMNTLGAIKFWELSTSKQPHFPALPNRWEGRDDLEEYRIAMALTKSYHTDGGAEGEDKDNNDDVSDGNETSDEESEEENYDLMTEEDMLQPKKYASSMNRKDVYVGPKSIFHEGAGVDGDWGRPTQQDIMEEKKHLRDEEMRKIDAANAQKNAELARIKAASKDHRYIARSKWIEDIQFKSKFHRKLKSALPYKSLHVCFNHKNLWMNTQKSSHPMEISYDFEFGLKGGWLPIITESQGDGTVQPFMKPESLKAKLSEDKVNQLQNEIILTLEAGLENARETKYLKTRLANEEVAPLLQAYMAASYDLKIIPQILRNGWDVSIDDKKIKWIKGSRGYKAHKKKRKLRKRLHDSVPQDYDYRLGIATMCSVDPEEIRAKVISPDERWTEKSGQGIPIYQLNAGGKETLCVTCKIISMPSKINFTMVGMMVIYPESALIVTD